ncbi:MAG: F0F1 ATP synthase subunit delta [Gammaproteobacteria bacterium]|nr:MAG: F0F1 ATP synthase subunit delta [Gammaproteobacteria bacterium]
MSEAITIARPYAIAVYRHAKSEDKLDLWSDMLEFMSSVVTDPAMAEIIADPRVEASKLSTLMLDICGGRLNTTAENFVRLLIDNGKLGLMDEIFMVFNDMKAEESGSINAELIAAYPVNAMFEQAIGTAMKKRLNRDLSFTTNIDKSLIGGVVIRAGDMVIDASVRGQIESLAAELRL